MKEEKEFSPTVDRFSGFAHQYDNYRPSPPKDLMETLSKLTKSEKPQLVVDLGCGTGLSTRPWASFAEKVVGVDPSPDMLREAQEKTRESNVTFQAGFGHETGLPDSCADIVTCASSLHWMEPTPTLNEVRRIMRSGGVFAAYGYQYPLPISSWEVELAYREFRKKLDAMEADRQVGKGLKRWPWNDVFGTMQQSGMFRYEKKLYLHTTLPWDFTHFSGWVRAHGGVQFLHQQGVSYSEMGVDRLLDFAESFFDEKPVPCLFCYQAQVGIT